MSTAPAGIPEWLIGPAPISGGLPPLARSGIRRRPGILSKTALGVTGLIRQAVFDDAVAARDGRPQRLDPRAKLLTVLAAIVAVSLLRSLPGLVLAYLATLGIGLGSGLGLGRLLKRVWLVVPAFTAVVVLPTTLSVVTPGDVVVPLWRLGGEQQGLTAQGLLGAALIVTRVATSISLALLLSMTTPWSRLLAASRALGVPKILVLITGMAYRYLFLLLATLEEMVTARAARTIAGGDDGRVGRRFAAAGAGTLFAKVHQLSDEVHQAMVARAFTGDARTLDRWRLSGIDLAWSLIVCGIFFGILLLDRWGIW